jgi:hypothetical protein
MGKQDDLTLYVGADEACHGQRRSAEYIVSTFSIKDVDGKTRTRKNSNRDFPEALAYVSAPGRDWRYGIFTGEDRLSSHNLSVHVPTLIESFLKDSELKISKVNAYFDGDLPISLAEEFIERASKIYELKDVNSFEVEGFRKRQNGKNERKKKMYISPHLVWVADSLASGIFRGRITDEDIFSHEKYVGLE